MNTESRIDRIRVALIGAIAIASIVAGGAAVSAPASATDSSSYAALVRFK